MVWYLLRKPMLGFLLVCQFALGGCGADPAVDQLTDDVGHSEPAVEELDDGDAASQAQAVGVVGFRAFLHPRCPDCDGRGNVCAMVEGFYGGAQRWLGGAQDMVAKCQRANALDLCGGSRACLRLSAAQRNLHRARNGGGCYQQCNTASIIWIPWGE